MPPSSKQKSYVQKNYPDSKSDLFAIFIEKCHSLTKKNAYQAMITMHSWMFLSSFEKLRNKLLINNTIINMAHLGARAFEDIGGEVVQTTAFVFDNANIKNYQSNFKRLVDYNSQDAKEEEYLKDDNLYTSSAANFSKIPGSPIAYWISKALYNCFTKNVSLSKIATTFRGLQPGNVDFIKEWYEVDLNNIAFNNKEELTWKLITTGGEYRKWYGNLYRVVKWYKNGYEIKNNPKAIIPNETLYFKPVIGWSRIASGRLSFRYYPPNMIPGDATGSIIFNNNIKMKFELAVLNSKVINYLWPILNSNLTNSTGIVNKIPVLNSSKISERKIENVEYLVNNNLSDSKKDWDSFETSWDFTVHPLVKNCVSTISEAYNLWNDECESRFNTLKSNEEELNRIFIDIYGLQDELDPYEEDKDVTVRKADLVRDIKLFISYAVGCMFGRYSLDTEGLAYAGGEWDNSKYSTFIPDADDIIPICDEEYFEDDIVTRFVEFVRIIYGSDTLEDNLSFISNALGGKGAPRDVLRNYFLNEFFKDFCKIYLKLPIYWLFDSGKKNGFKALVYIHRYTPDLIARLRTGYVHPLQARYRTQVELLQSQIDDASSTSERVKLSKQLKKINEQLLELNKYEEVVHHWADKMEPMDLDDGVKANYAKFQELLAKIK